MLSIFKDELIPKETKLQVMYKDDGLLDRMINCDGSRLQILIYNLVKNSIAHTYGGEVHVKLKLLDEDRKNEKLIKHAKSKNNRRSNQEVKESDQDSS